LLLMAAGHYGSLFDSQIGTLDGAGAP